MLPPRVVPVGDPCAPTLNLKNSQISGDFVISLLDLRSDKRPASPAMVHADLPHTLGALRTSRYFEIKKQGRSVPLT
jgi:hypothetical protein